MHWYNMYEMVLWQLGICMRLVWNMRDQGRTEPPRGHATSNSANIDSIVLNVTKNRGPPAAFKTAHTIEVLISIYKYTLT